MQGSRRISVSSAPDGSWEMVEGAVDPALRGLVRDYVGFREVVSGRPLVRRETPSEVVTLIVSFGAALEVGPVGERAERFSGSFLARISAVPAVTSFTGVSEGVQVDLSPLGAHMLLDLPMDELPEPAVDLGSVIGPVGERLGERLAAMAGWGERFDWLDDLLLERFAAARAPRPSVEWAWRSLLASGGSVPIGSLTDRLGCSPRHLIDGFKAQVGVTPKTAAAIIRFGRAAALLRRPEPIDLASVAQRAGYHDQSHMTRDFRRFAGTTPGAFAAARHPSHLGVDETKVKSVQDGGAAAA